jgi:hypothetical protein
MQDYLYTRSPPMAPKAERNHAVIQTLIHRKWIAEHVAKRIRKYRSSARSFFMIIIILFIITWL